ncbi:MAG: sigma-70 family RNA polymerase sigma factor [Actinobacteria bacterium]|nr:sigma-70 family RNA polymerase sigma factor [Actinomycetota bacterium]
MKSERNLNSTCDEALISKVARGDNHAATALIIRYQGKIFNFSMRFLDNRDDAFDVTQETFLRMIRGAVQFRGESKFSTWLFSIAANLARDKIKARKIFIEISNDDDDSEIFDFSSDYDLEEAVINKIDGQSLIDAIVKLPVKLKEVLILCDISGFKYEEISRMVNIPIGTVKSRINRAREQMLRTLKGK